MNRHPLPHFHDMADAMQQLKQNPRLRPYQQAALDALRDAASDGQPVRTQIAQGAGKTRAALAPCHCGLLTGACSCASQRRA